MRRLLAGAVVSLALSLAPPVSAQVYQWGTWIGAGEKVATPFPALVEVPGEVTAVQVGNGASYYLNSAGAEYAIGDGAGGELGNGSEEAETYTPKRVTFPEGTVIVAIGEAKNDGFAIDSHHHLWAWGGNDSGDLCLGHSKKVLTPEEVPGIETSQVEGGGQHVLILLTDGKVDACGLNKNGQLGVSSSVASTKSPLPVPGLEHVAYISSGSSFSGALTESGELYEWGADEQGQTGNGKEQAAVYTPERVAEGASYMSLGGDVEGNGHTLALIGGEVVGWGADSAGQIGNGVKVNAQLTHAYTGLHYATVVASGTFSFGLEAGGTLEGWGANTGDGLGISGKNSLLPSVTQTGVALVSSTAEKSGSVG